MNFRMAVVLSVLFLLLVAVSASTQAPHNTAQDEQCVMCHVETYNQGLAQKFKHEPFFERQCTLCHVVDTAPALTESPVEILKTGEPVSQGVQWTRRTVIAANGALTLDHLALLTGLKDNESYRFRLIGARQNALQGPDAVPTLWLGLIPSDLTGTTARPGATQVFDLSNKTDGSISEILLYRDGSSGIFVSWQTRTPLFGWIEVETLQRVSSKTALSSTSQDATHPKLRDPEQLTIDICYLCHSSGSLGTSHPVRLYSRGGKTVIPNELPTIRDGMMTCVTCHAPHGSAGKQLVRETVKTKLCVACHIQFKGSSKSTLF